MKILGSAALEKEAYLPTRANDRACRARSYFADRLPSPSPPPPQPPPPTLSSFFGFRRRGRRVRPSSFYVCSLARSLDRSLSPWPRHDSPATEATRSRPGDIAAKEGRKDAYALTHSPTDSLPARLGRASRASPLPFVDGGECKSVV